MKKITKEELRDILAGRFVGDTHTSLAALPLPGSFKDMDRAAARIIQALRGGERIALVGDYDADGVISCLILSEFFEALGAEVAVSIPNRFKDGYGLNEAIVRELAAAGISLIITVDNGISAHPAAAICEELGLDLIITDHHNPPPSLPPAFAIINPKQPGCGFPPVEICGAQVAWYLAAAIKAGLGARVDMGGFLELLAIAIVGDMMELRDLNRVLVRAGLARLNASRRAAFVALREFYRRPRFCLDDLGFLLAPLINSPGRMDSAMISYEFLRTKDLAQARALLGQIVNFNEARKAEERKIIQDCLTQIAATGGEGVEGGGGDVVVAAEGVAGPPPCLIVKGPWHEGVLGIVAGRLAAQFKRPAIVFCEKENFLKASARSAGRVDLLSLITAAAPLLSSYGGHRAAAGLSVGYENYEEFKRTVLAAAAAVAQEDFLDAGDLLGRLDPAELDYELLEILEHFEPYGHKNPRPCFVFEGLLVRQKKRLGQDEQHLRMLLGWENRGGGTAVGGLIEGVIFNFDGEGPRLGEEISLIAQVGKNDYQGPARPQLLIREFISTTQG